MAEQAEKRKDAKVAREYEIALPAELPREAQRALALKFAQALADRYHIAADVALHAPDRKGDERNIHAHILTTTRRITENGVLADKTRELDVKTTAAQHVMAIRELWADIANAELARHGRDERIDHRTLKAQGIDREPQIHVGVHATAMERRGVDTEKGARNREIQARNAELTEVQRAVDEYNQHIAEYRSALEQARAKQTDTPTQKPEESTKTPETENYTPEQVQAAYKAIADAERAYREQYDQKRQAQIAAYEAEAAAKRKDLEEWERQEPQKKLLERQSAYKQRWAGWNEVRQGISEAAKEAERKARRLDPHSSENAWAEGRAAIEYAHKQHPKETQIIAWAENRAKEQREQRSRERLKERAQQREEEQEL